MPAALQWDGDEVFGMFAYEFLLVAVRQLIGNISFHVSSPIEKPQIKTKKNTQ